MLEYLQRSIEGFGNRLVALLRGIAPCNKLTFLPLAMRDAAAAVLIRAVARGNNEKETVV